MAMKIAPVLWVARDARGTTCLCLSRSLAGLCSIGPPPEIVSTKQHTAIGIEQPGVQLLGSSEFYHQPVRVKYPAQCRVGEVARLSGILQRIHGQDAHHGLTTQLAQENGKCLGFGVPRWWTRVQIPSFWFHRHFENLPCGLPFCAPRRPPAGTATTMLYLSTSSPT